MVLVISQHFKSQVNIVKKLKLTKLLVVFLGISPFVIYSVAIWFYWNKKFLFLSDSTVGDFDPALWGQFGDFIGGLLNPLFAVMTFAAILYTVLVQREELALQRTELRISNETLISTQAELAQSRRIANEQVNHIKKESIKSDISKVLDLLDKELEGLIVKKTKNLIHHSQNDIDYAIERWLNTSSKTAPNQFDEDGYLSLLGKVISCLSRINENLVLFDNCEPNSPVTYYYEMKYFHYADQILEAGAIAEEKVSFFLQNLEGAEEEKRSE